MTIGGSYTVIPYVAHVAAMKLSWLSHAQMLDGFALAEKTPGPLIIVVGFVGLMAGFHHFLGSILMGAIALVVTIFYTFLPCSITPIYNPSGDIPIRIVDGFSHLNAYAENEGVRDPIVEVFNSAGQSNSAKFGEVRRNSMNIEMMRHRK